MTSARNLLAYGIRAIRTAAFIDTTRDPILTMLSIGVEKLYKLTLGLIALDQKRAWPSTAAMKAWGHKLASMHETVMEELRVRSSGKSEYVRDRLGAVQADAVVLPLIEALDVYGRMGRFCYLDLLGDEPQSWVSPKAAWAKIESAALNDPVVAALHSAAMTNVGDNDVWSRFIRGLNGVFKVKRARPSRGDVR